MRLCISVPICAWAVCSCACMCVHRSQLQSTVKVSVYLIRALFSGLSAHSLTSPLDIDRHSQVALSDCYHWLSPPSPHTPSLPCLSFSLSHILSHPFSPLVFFFSFPCLSSAFGCALTWLSLWVCFAGQPSACYSSPALIKEENWNPFNQTPQPHTHPLPRIAVQGEHGRGGLRTPKWLKQAN